MPTKQRPSGPLVGCCRISQENNTIRIVLISDTHGRRPQLPMADVLIHAGDLCSYGSLDELEEAAKWLGSGRQKMILAIGGNHDWPFMRTPILARKILEDQGIHYLEDEAFTWHGLKFYGSPWTPTFFHWAFMKDRGEQIAAVWHRIPTDTDVLITHGPPKDILDIAISEPHAGCADLKYELQTRVHPKIHVFGHLHAGYGQFQSGRPDDPLRNTRFINASICNEQYLAVNAPIVLEI